MHARDFGKALAEALHAAPFVIHTDQHVRFHGMDAVAEFFKLRGIFVVAGKKNHHAHQGTSDASNFVVGEFGGSNVADKRTGHGRFPFRGVFLTVILQNEYGRRL